MLNLDLIIKQSFKFGLNFLKKDFTLLITRTMLLLLRHTPCYYNLIIIIIIMCLPFK